MKNKNASRRRSRIYQYILSSVGVFPIHVLVRQVAVNSEDAGIVFICRALLWLTIYVVYFIIANILCEIYRKTVEEK